MTDLIQRPRRLRKSPALRAMFEETTLSLNDLVLPIFVEEEIDDYKAVEAMPGVMRIPEKHLAREIERIANAGIRSVMTFGISHHTDETGSDAWREDGLVARMSRICKQTVPEMIVMSDTCFCEYTSHGHCGVLCEHGVDNDATLENLGKQAVVAAAAGADFIALPPRWMARYRRFARRWTLLALKIRRLCRIRPSSPPPFMVRSVKLPEAH
ncbi:delta-aminolevulinic acid dehydratase [Escherichia coli]|nr:delta-aminolevulinic acid dehydratase [Escherichia coli]